jgi:hypothetical protein
MSDSIPYCLISSTPWKTFITVSTLTQQQFWSWYMVHSSETEKWTCICRRYILNLLSMTTKRVPQKFHVNRWQPEVAVEEQLMKAIQIQMNKNSSWHEPAASQTHIHCQRGWHTSLDTDWYMHIAALARTRGLWWLM